MTATKGTIFNRERIVEEVEKRHFEMDSFISHWEWREFFVELENPYIGQG